MAASTTKQSQGGSDVAVTTRKPSQVESTRTEPARTVKQTSKSGEETSISTTPETTSVNSSKERIGCTLSFTIKVLSNLAPAPLKA